MLDLSSSLPPMLGAAVGIGIKYLYDFYAEKRKFKKELEDNNNIDVTGEWYVAWQTSVDGEEIVNTENLRIEQKGKTIKLWNTEKSPENPKAGYFWEGQMQFFQGRNVMGWYFPKKEENNASKGIIYMTFISPRKLFIGKWVGTAYDGEIVTGYVVIKKDRASAKQELEMFIKKHPQDIRLISYTGLG